MTDKKTISITYDIVTEQSSQDGDAAERGYYLPGGWHYAQKDDGTYPDADTAAYDIEHDTIKEVAEAAISDGFRPGEGCDWLEWTGDDWTAETSDGEAGCETRAMHKGDDITDDEWALIREWVDAGRVDDGDVYEVVVGNIGTVYSGPSATKAQAAFEEYRAQARNGYGRAAGEEVTLFIDDEVEDQWEPTEGTSPSDRIPAN